MSSNVSWSISDKLNIFANPKYDHKLIIAPTSANKYSFVIENQTALPVKYSFVFSDINENKINMKYKLKLENVYLAGSENEYVGIEELNMSNLVIANESKALYTIEWMWEEQSDILDTLAAGQKYELNIAIEVNENGR